MSRSSAQVVEGRENGGRAEPGWLRLGAAAVVAGPALLRGGVACGVWALVLGVLAIAVVFAPPPSRRTTLPPFVPWLIACAVCAALGALPISAAVARTIAPGLAPVVAEVAAASGVERWPTLGASPAASILDATRLLALAGVAWIGARAGERWIALCVACVAAAQPIIGMLRWGIRSPVLEAWLGTLEHKTNIVLLGTFVHPNHQAWLSVLGLLCAIGLSVRAEPLRQASSSRERERRLALATLACACAIGCVMTLSRAAWIGAAAASILSASILGLALTRARAASDRAGLGAALASLAAAWVVALGAGTVFLYGLVGREWTSLVRGGALDSRIEGLAADLELLRQAPVFGIGRGAYVDVRPWFITQGTTLSVHVESSLVGWIVEVGPWLGVGTLIVGLALALGPVRSAIAGRARPHGPHRLLVWVALAAVALGACLDFSLEGMGVSAPFFALLGALTGRAARSHRVRAPAGHARAAPADPRDHARADHRRASSSCGSSRWVAALGLAGACIATVAMSGLQPSRRLDQALTLGHRDASSSALAWRPLHAELHVALARQALARGDCDRVRAHVGIVARPRPAAIEPRLMLAACADREGRHADADALLASVLAQSTGPVPPSLAAFIARHSDLARWKAIAPRDPSRWTPWFYAVLRQDPLAALRMARATLERDEGGLEDPEQLGAVARAFVEVGEWEFALHFARQRLALQPSERVAIAAWARIALKLDEPRRAEADRVLQAALEAGLDRDGELLELRIVALNSLPNAAPDTRAALCATLIELPGDRATRARRRERCRH